MKTLKQIMGDLGGYQPKPEGEQNFVKKHVVDKKEDMNGNGDDVFKAAKVKTADRPGERHGYTDADDDKVNEEAEWVSILKKYKVIGKTEAEKKPVAEQVEAEEKAQLGENVDARARFEDYHRDAAEMVKKIGEALKAHKASVGKDGTHWGHVGDVKHFHRQLQDLHDQLTQQGEYQRAIGAPMREGVELEEKHLTPAEMKKREEIAQAIERETPGMDKSKKMAIATAQAKKVAEEVELEEAVVPAHVKHASEILKKSWGKNEFHKRTVDGKVTVDYTTDKDKAHKLAQSHVDTLKKHGVHAEPRVTRSERQGMPFWYHGVTVKSSGISEAKEAKKSVRGKGVPATGVYDSIPLGISVKEEVSEDIDTSLLEMFVALDEEEQKMFVEMLESDGELLGEIAKEAK